MESAPLDPPLMNTHLMESSLMDRSLTNPRRMGPPLTNSPPLDQPLVETPIINLPAVGSRKRKRKRPRTEDSPTETSSEPQNGPRWGKCICSLCDNQFSRPDTIRDRHWAICVKARGNPNNLVWDADKSCWPTGRSGPSGVPAKGVKPPVDGKKGGDVAIDGHERKAVPFNHQEREAILTDHLERGGVRANGQERRNNPVDQEHGHILVGVQRHVDDPFNQELEPALGEDEELELDERSIYDEAYLDAPGEDRKV